MDISILPSLTVTPLCQIMEKFGSDKGTATENGRNWHNYTQLYHPLFSPVRDTPVRLFEMGLGTNNTSFTSNMGVTGKPGASLEGWSEYFYNTDTRVFGADIDKNVLFNKSRISTFYCDQTSEKDIKTMWDSPELKEGFDIIIDDGLHTFEANRILFMNSVHKLKPGGVYVIEDILNEYIGKWHAFLAWWRGSHPEYLCRLVTLKHPQNDKDNTLILFQLRG